MIEVTTELLQSIAKLPKPKRVKAMKLLGEQEFARCADDPIYWFDAKLHANVPYVYTLDPHPMYTCNICADGNTYTFNKLNNHLIMRHAIEDASTAMIRETFTELPTTRPFTLMEYMRPIIHWWQREQLMAIEKSRDMFATWTIVSLYAWDTIFHKGRQNIFQSEDAAKTLELVKRAWFIYQNQPKFLRLNKAFFTSSSTRSGAFIVPELNSEILGFPQGPDQIRQLHPGGIFLDEAAYQMLAGDSFAACKPAIQNGGRVTMVSSANPGFFMAICRDTIDAAQAD